jgi:hypothetical protein
MKRTALLATALAILAAAATRADNFAAKGAKATLTVEYVYASNGKTQDRNDSHQWSVTRTVKLSADLIAQTPQPLPTMHEMEAGQKADLKNKQEKAQSAQEKMAPVQADIEKIMAKCGEDEACLEREIQKYGMSNADSAKMNTARSADKDIAVAANQGPARYQLWTAASQRGTYSIEETRHEVLADPACGAKAAASGPPSLAMAEIDAGGKTVAIVLPVPLSTLPYTKTIKSNSPDRKSGTFQDLVRCPPKDLKPVRVALKGGGRDESGTEEIKIAGAGADGGTLTIRWKLTAK